MTCYWIGACGGSEELSGLMIQIKYVCTKFRSFGSSENIQRKMVRVMLQILGNRELSLVTLINQQGKPVNGAAIAKFTRVV